MRAARPSQSGRSRAGRRLPGACLALTAAACGGDTQGPDASSSGDTAPPPAAGRIEGTPAVAVELDSPTDPRAWFRDEALSRGIDFVYDSGHDGEQYWFPEIVGGGAALFDMDVDGDLDVYLVQAGSILAKPEARAPNRLFANDGGGHFEDVTEGSGADDRGYGMGVAAADFDNDGDPDLYVTNVGVDVLLRNDRGDGTRFFDASATSGVEESGWSVSASPLDYDEDGFLDLFVVSYIFWSPSSERECLQPAFGPDYCSPKSYEAPAPDTLLRNDGDGTFTNVSSAVGIRTAFGNGLGCVAADFDMDGWTDVFVANDGTENQLWINQGGQTFKDFSLMRGVAVDDDGKKKAGMGTAAADLDDDGDDDLIVVNLDTESDSLYENRGPYFKDSSARFGLRVVTRRYTRWGVGLLDFDNDGALDLYQANGRVERQTDYDTPFLYAEPNSLLSGGHEPNYFQPVELQGGTAETIIRTSRAAAFGDIDADGGVDVLVVNRDGPTTLLRNVVADRGKFVSLRVLDEHGRDALGVRVTAALGGDRTVVRTVRTDSSYCAANDPRVHLGLGALDGVDDLRVTWLDGTSESFGPIPAGSRPTLRRGEGTSH